MFIITLLIVVALSFLLKISCIREDGRQGTRISTPVAEKVASTVDQDRSSSCMANIDTVCISCECSIYIQKYIRDFWTV